MIADEVPVHPSKTLYSLFAKARKALRDPVIVGNFLQHHWSLRERTMDVAMMMALFSVWPEQIYRFSTRKFLPNKKQRLSRRTRPTMPFTVVESRTSTDLPRIKELNLVMRGTSFDIGQLENLNSPICLVNYYPITMAHHKFWEHHAPIETDKDVFYAMTNAAVVRELLKLKLQVLWIETCCVDRDGSICPHDGGWQSEWYEQMLDNPLCKRVSMKVRVFGDTSSPRQPVGSGLSTIGACSVFADIMNVYGWDFYLKTSPENMNHWKLCSNMVNYRLDVGRRRRNVFESALINFYYAYQLARLPNIKIHGYLGQLARHEKLVRRIERVLFNP